MESGTLVLIKQPILLTFSDIITLLSWLTGGGSRPTRTFGQPINTSMDLTEEHPPHTTVSLLHRPWKVERESHCYHIIFLCDVFLVYWHLFALFDWLTVTNFSIIYGVCMVWNMSSCFAQVISLWLTFMCTSLNGLDWTELGHSQPN